MAYMIMYKHMQFCSHMEMYCRSASPGGIIPYEISHCEFLLSRLLIPSFNSSMSRQPLTKSILKGEPLSNPPHRGGYFLNCDVENVIADKGNLTQSDKISLMACQN